MIRRPPRSTLFPYNDALPICQSRPIRNAVATSVAARSISSPTTNPRRGSLSTMPPAMLVTPIVRSEEHTSELQSHLNLVCRLLLEKKKEQEIIERACSDTNIA